MFFYPLKTSLNQCEIIAHCHGFSAAVVVCLRGVEAIGVDAENVYVMGTLRVDSGGCYGLIIDRYGGCCGMME